MSNEYERQLRSFIAAAEAQGWTVSRTGSDHWRFTPADPDAAIAIAPSTSAGRAADNLKSQLRRSGLILP